MKVPKQENWRWFAAFDNLDHFQKASRALVEVGHLEEAEYVLCPDGQNRMTIEVNREFLHQLKTVSLGGEKLAFQVLVKRSHDADFSIVRESGSEKPKKPRASSQLGRIILGSSLLRRQQRHAAKSK